MKTHYCKTPTRRLAMNFKVGSASLVRAVIKSHYPEVESLITTPHGDGTGTAYPEGHSADTQRWHGYVAKEETPTAPVVLMVRDPVEKFRSACAETGVTDIDGKLTTLENDWGRDAHFWPQSRFQGQLKLYRFPDDLDAAATELGLSLPLPNIAGNNGPKPDLTPEQLAKVQELYADDIALYESIAEAGQELVVPLPEPEPEPPKPLRERLKAVTGSFPAALRASFPFERVSYWLDQGDEEAAQAVVEAVDVSGQPQAIQDAKAALLLEFEK